MHIGIEQKERLALLGSSSHERKKVSVTQRASFSQGLKKTEDQKLIILSSDESSCKNKNDHPALIYLSAIRESLE